MKPRPYAVWRRSGKYSIRKNINNRKRKHRGGKAHQRVLRMHLHKDINRERKHTEDSRGSQDKVRSDDGKNNNMDDANNAIHDQFERLFQQAEEGINGIDKIKHQRLKILNNFFYNKPHKKK